MNINNVQLFGNLTRDPELKTLEGGSLVCKVGLATNHEWKSKDGEKQSEVTFHNLVIWGKMGETIAQYMKKGDNAYFEGRLKINEWEDDNGDKRSRAEIVVDRFKFGINKRDDSGAAKSPSKSAAKDKEEDILPDL